MINLKKYFKNNKKYFFNFLFYEFKIDYNRPKKNLTWFFILKKITNKGNYFLINLIEKISYKHKIAVIGDIYPKFKNTKNITKFWNFDRKRAT